MTLFLRPITCFVIAHSAGLLAGQSLLDPERPPYPTYDQVITEFKNYAKNNASICKYEVLGKSQGGKDIPMLILTKDVASNKAKPIYWVSAATHGNEEMGTYTIMNFIKSLLASYETGDDLSGKVIEQGEWHLAPILNPDGYLAVRRTLNDRTDPNRSFGWQIGYKNGSEAVHEPLVAPEIQAYSLHFTKYPAVVAIDFHTGMTSNITPWFSDNSKKPDDQEAFSAVVKHLNKAAGKRDTRSGLPGLQTDFAYAKMGALSICSEQCKDQGGLPSNAASISEKYVKALQDLFVETQKGVAGRILDKDTKQPLYARVAVQGSGTGIYSSPVNGGYFKYLPQPPSTLTLSIQANGYKEKTVQVATEEFDAIQVKDFELERDPKCAMGAMAIECLRCYNYPALSEARQALGLRDGKALTLQANGSEKAYLIVDMGPNTPVHDNGGKEITVVTMGSGSYTLYAGTTLNEVTRAKSLKKIGQGSGTATMDLKATGLKQARYLRLEVTSGSVQLDAIEAVQVPN